MDRGSQWGEDLWIAQHLSPPGKGVFVEVGVHTGLENSNTIYFEDRGWTGLLVEPDPRNHAAIRMNRKADLVTCAAGRKVDVQVLGLDPNPSWSSLKEIGAQTAVPVTVYPLNDLLAYAGIDRVDILSIDTEGTELDVWEGFSAAKYQPAIVIMEYVTNNMPPQDQEILGRLACDGYMRVHQTECNLILVKA